MTTTAVRKNVTVAVFRSHAEAEAVIKELRQAGFDIVWNTPMTFFATSGSFDVADLDEGKSSPSSGGNLRIRSGING